MWTQFGRIVNRGFFYGPWLPVYGVGSVLLYQLLSPIRKRPFAVFFLSGVLGSLTELIIGLTLDTYWNLHYWDYTGLPLSVGSYVCLYSFLGFCFAGHIWVCYLSAWLKKCFFHLPVKFRRLSVSVLTLIFLTDFCYSIFHPNQGEGITFSFSLVSYTFGL